MQSCESRQPENLKYDLLLYQMEHRTDKKWTDKDGSDKEWRKRMRFVIVTGVSGAGKTAALKMLEDANYFCVDNLPIPLLEKFASLMPEIHGEDVQNVALGIDARSGRSLDELEMVLDRMEKAGYQFEILFLDAEDSVLVKRYKETRRSHPLAMGGRVDDGIRMEREKMRFLKERADYIIDTSHLLTRELR